MCDEKISCVDENEAWNVLDAKWMIRELSKIVDQYFVVDTEGHHSKEEIGMISGGVEK